jgi:HK97 family phage major capsid protein
MLLSLPVLVNPAMPAHTGLVIDRTAVVSAVGPLVVATSTDRYFDSDSVALRATWRAGHAVVRPDRIGKFAITAGS